MNRFQSSNVAFNVNVRRRYTKADKTKTETETMNCSDWLDSDRLDSDWLDAVAPPPPSEDEDEQVDLAQTIEDIMVRPVQVDSIKTRVESAYGFSA